MYVNKKNKAKRALPYEIFITIFTAHFSIYS